MEDALKHLLDCDESGRGATVESLAGALARSRRQCGGNSRPPPRPRTGHCDRRHPPPHRGRADCMRCKSCAPTGFTKPGSPAKRAPRPADWHREAHKAEHHIEAAEVDAMADRLNNPRFDPHGDPIPTREGHMPKRPLTSLASWPDGSRRASSTSRTNRKSLFRQAEALGLAPGTRIDESRHLSDGSIEALVEGRRLVDSRGGRTADPCRPDPDPDDEPPADLGRLSDLAGRRRGGGSRARTVLHRPGTPPLAGSRSGARHAHPLRVSPVPSAVRGVMTSAARSSPCATTRRTAFSFIHPFPRTHELSRSPRTRRGLPGLPVPLQPTPQTRPARRGQRFRRRPRGKSQHRQDHRLQRPDRPAHAHRQLARKNHQPRGRRIFL